MRTFKIARLAAVCATAALCASLAACSAPMASNEASAGRDIALVPSSSGGADMAALDAEMIDASTAVSQQGRSIISNGGITLEVDEVQPLTDEVAQIANGLGGYVETQYMGGRAATETTYASLTIRVPADQFDAAFAALSDLGTVVDENRSATDVTTQHVDLQARVEALETSVERLTELMSGAATTSELLEAEAALSSRQAELDSLRAQLESLEGQISEATIAVTLTTTSSTLPGGPDNFWEGLLAGLSSLAAAGAGALVLLGVLLPWLAVAAVIAIAVIAIVRARRRKTHVTAAPVTAAPSTPEAPVGAPGAPRAPDSTSDQQGQQPQ